MIRNEIDKILADAYARQGMVYNPIIYKVYDCREEYGHDCHCREILHSH